MRKTADSGENLHEALLAYHQTPLTGIPNSPKNILFGRNIRDPLPCTNNHIKPKTLAVRDLLIQQQPAQIARHDQPSKPLQDGKEVVSRTDKKEQWMPGQVVAAHGTPRFYAVDNSLNQVRRNRVHIKPAAAETPELQVTVELREEGNFALNIPSTPQSSGQSLSRISTRRSARPTKGNLPLRFKNFQMG